MSDYFKFNFSEYKRTGTSGENLYLPFSSNVKSDIDHMFEFLYIHVIDPEQFTAAEKDKYGIDNKISLLYIDYSNKKYRCYITLYSYSTHEIIEVNEKTDSSILLFPLLKGGYYAEMSCVRSFVRVCVRPFVRFYRTEKMFFFDL